MDLWQLEYFVKVAETESIAEAAKKLSISAPPLSRQIKKFEEDEIGVPLFTHTAKAVKLNETGKAFFRDARRILQMYADAKHRAKSLSPVPPNKIHLGYAGSPTAEFLDAAIQTYEQQFRGRHVVRHPVTVRECFDGLMKRKLDLVLLVQPLRRMDPTLEFRKLLDYQARCVVGFSHPLASKSFVQVQELKEEKFLIFSRTEAPQYYDYFRRWFKPHKFLPETDDDYDDIETLFPAVEAGHGLALLLSPAETEARRRGFKLKFLPIRPDFPKTNVGALLLPPISDHITVFLEIVTKKIAALRKPMRHA